MKSKIYSSDYMRTATKGQLWIPVLLTLGYLMAFPVMTLLLLGNWFGTSNMTLDQIRELYETLWVDGLMSSGFIITSVAAAINGINNFWYLYSSRKTDFYHCLPIKRSRIFLHKTIMGILYYLIPYLVMEFLTVCLGAMRGFFSLKLMKMAVMMPIMHLILYLVFYFAVVVVICLIGNILMGALCLAALVLYGNVLGILIVFYRTVFYKTFYYDQNWGLLKFLEEYASPVTLGKSFLYQYSSGSYQDFMYILLATAAVLGILAYTAFLKRPSESAGRPVIYGWVSVVMKFMVVVPCGLGVGMIFHTLPEKSAQMIWWIFGMSFGTILSHGCMEVLFQMDFRKFMAKKHHLVVAGLLVASCALNYKMDLLHFDEYFPAREKIEAINADFTEILTRQDNYYIWKKENGVYQTIAAWSSEEAAVTGENGIGEDTWNTLQKIISSQEIRSTGVTAYAYTDTYMNDDNENGWKYVLPVKYTLNNGREIYRRYYLNSEDVHDLLECLYKEGTLKELKNSFLDIDDKYLKGVYGTFMDGQYYRLFQNQSQKNAELLKAMREDIEEASAEELLGEPCASIEFQYEIPRTPTSYDWNIRADGFAYDNYHATVMVYPTFKRTLAILEETGYPLTMEEVDFDHVTVTYWDMNNNSDANAQRSVEYSRNEELGQLKKGIVPSGLRVNWLNYESGLDVQYVLKESTDWYGISGYLLSDRTPDFIEKTKKEACTEKLQSAEE